MILYPAWSRHHVRPVTRGARLASFFWIQSMVREEACRRILFDLDLAIQSVNREAAGSSAAVSLTGVYHNLLRRWASV
jgi:PKHD-type hydroxylase